MYDASISGLRAAETRLAAAAHNTANINTEGARAWRVRQAELPERSGTAARAERTELPPDLLEDSIERIGALRYGQANAAALRAQDELTGMILNIRA